MYDNFTYEKYDGEIIEISEVLDHHEVKTTLDWLKKGNNPKRDWSGVINEIIEKYDK